MLVNLLLEKRRTNTRSLLEDDETSQSQHSFPRQIEALDAMLQFRFIANRKGVITSYSYFVSHCNYLLSC
jgi:hypothetical protein